MDYYKLLQLEREPFSNSPDPDYFFQSRQHAACLHRLELALRLRRGLNVVIGEVGTGKTTLCRELIRRFADQADFETHLILDPAFDTPAELLAALCHMLAGMPPSGDVSAGEIKERIKQALFTKGVDQKRTVVLIIDEGQKIPPPCIELLRELLNFETNDFKLLQIVIFAQPEFEPILRSHANFADRINMLHHLHPMDFRDTRQMILYRLRLASRDAGPRTLFTLPALWSIYRASRGYPRRIINLCHQSVLAMIIQNQTRAGWRLIRSCRNRIQPLREQSRTLVKPLLYLIIAMAAGAALFTQWDRLTRDRTQQSFKIPPAPDEATPAPATEPEPALADPAAITADTLESGTAAAAVPASDASPPPAQTSQAPRSDLPAPVPERAAQPEPPVTESTPAPPRIETLPPRILGTVIVRPGDSMVSIVRTLYGGYRHRLLRAMIDANPAVLDPNNIEIGEELAVPAVPFPLAGAAAPASAWVHLRECETLSDALAYQSELEQRWNLPSRLLSFWAPATGLRFNVTLPKPFLNPDQAEARLAAIRQEIAPLAHRIDTWPSEAHFYSIVPMSVETGIED